MITAFIRTVILYLLLIVGLRLTGKRQIGELEPIELVLTMLLSDIAAVPMQDYGIPLFYGLVPIVTLLSLSTLLSYASLRSVKLRNLICGEATVIIQDGRILQSAMRRNRLTLDELLEELRGQGISDLQSVKYAVLETSGKLSILPYAQELPLTAKALGQQVADDVSLPTVLIDDGRLMTANLRRCGRDETWLRGQLRQHGIAAPEDAFCLMVDEQGTVTCLPKEGRP